MKDSLTLAKAVKLGLSIAGYQEAPVWASANTDEDLMRALDSSRHRGEILALSEEGHPDDWTSLDVAEPANGQMIYVMMDNWDKPSCGTYIRDGEGERVQLYRDKFLTIPVRRSAMFWKACALPEGLPRKTPRYPEARGYAYKNDMKRAERESYTGHRGTNSRDDKGFRRQSPSFPSDHSYRDEFQKPSRDLRHHSGERQRRFEK